MKQVVLFVVACWILSSHIDMQVGWLIVGTRLEEEGSSTE